MTERKISLRKHEDNKLIFAGWILGFVSALMVIGLYLILKGGP